MLKRRWVVGRTFAWLGRRRRPSQGDEALPASEEAWSCRATANLLVRRLARRRPFSNNVFDDAGEDAPTPLG